MRGDSSISTRWRVAILAITFVLCGLAERARCDRNGPVLLLQQTPPQGGMISPDEGVHRFGLNAMVTLTATPKPGYQFVCWLGEVSNTTANSTMVYLDAPKIVIAVFERAEYAFLGADQLVTSIPGGSWGGSVGSTGDYSGGSGGGGSGGGRKGRQEQTLIYEGDPSDDFPVPERIPEPATGAMLLLGSLLSLSRRGRRGVAVQEPSR